MLQLVALVTATEPILIPSIYNLMVPVNELGKVPVTVVALAV